MGDFGQILFLSRFQLTLKAAWGYLKRIDFSDKEFVKKCFEIFLK